jgi:hypothetical protein
MLFVALNRTKLRSWNGPGYRSPPANTHGWFVAAVHRFVRVGGSTPAHSYTPVHLCDVRNDSRNLTSCVLRFLACSEQNVDERNTHVRLPGRFTHIRMDMRKNQH